MKPKSKKQSERRERLAAMFLCEIIAKSKVVTQEEGDIESYLFYQETVRARCRGAISYADKLLRILDGKEK